MDRAGSSCKQGGRALLASAAISPVGTEPERFSVSAGGLAERLENWSEIAATALVAFEMRPSERTASDFRGVIRRWRFGELTLVECAALPCAAHRDQALVDEQLGGSSEPLLGVQLMQQGVEVARDRQRGSVTISPGDLMLWDGRRTVAVEALAPIVKRTLVFPGQLIFSICPRLVEQPVLPRLQGTPAGRLLARYIDALVHELPNLDAVGRIAAARAALELVRAAVEPLFPDSRDTIRAAMREEIRRYVRTHLQEPKLGPTSIARAYSISVRGLHGLFEESDESVAALVRQERLARCMEDLQRPDGGSVTSIAFRWGFCDTAHFSRVFKRTFGVRPSEVRQTALEHRALPS